MYPVDLPDIEEDGEETADYCNSPKGTGEEDRGAVQEEILSGRRSKYQVMEETAEEISKLMEDLYQSGFDTVHDSTLEDMKKYAGLTEQYGMKHLSGLLAGMTAEITAGRHRMERETAPMAELYTEVTEYLYLCRQKTAYDRGRDYYKS